MRTVKPLFNESPAMLARRIGTSVPALFAANPHKPTTVVAGKRTFQSLHQNESLNVPSGSLGFVGAIAPASPSAPHAMIQQGSSGADVALWQTIIGVTPDGGFGPQTAAATKAWQSAHGLNPDGVVGPKTWAAALGTTAPAPAPTAATTPVTAPSAGLLASASAAVAALAADSNYCVSVGRVGTPVNTAVHNFKAAWNSANPGNPVPIGTGKYEPVVAQALSSALGGITVPPGCGAGAPAPAPQQPAAQAQPAPVSSAPAAVMALSAIDPCNQANASIVAAAQAALGVGADGKYGSDTAAAARRVFPGAPAACSPRPAWWSPPGQSNASSGAAQAAQAAQAAAQAAAAAAKAAQAATTPAAAAQAATQAAAAATAAQTAAQTAAPAQQAAAQAAATQASQAAQTAQAAAAQQGGGGAITPPAATKGLSKGAIVAGAVGAVALVGLAAVALTGKKGHRRSGGGRRRKSGAKRKKR